MPISVNVSIGSPWKFIYENEVTFEILELSLISEIKSGDDEYLNHCTCIKSVFANLTAICEVDKIFNTSITSLYKIK